MGESLSFGTMADKAAGPKADMFLDSGAIGSRRLIDPPGNQGLTPKEGFRGTVTCVAHSVDLAYPACRRLAFGCFAGFVVAANPASPATVAASPATDRGQEHRSRRSACTCRPRQGAGTSTSTKPAATTMLSSVTGARKSARLARSVLPGDGPGHRRSTQAQTQGWHPSPGRHEAVGGTGRERQCRNVLRAREGAASDAPTLIGRPSSNCAAPTASSSSRVIHRWRSLGRATVHDYAEVARRGAPDRSGRGTARAGAR